MPTIRAVGEIVLNPAHIRKEIKACEAKLKLLREQLQTAEKAERLQRALAETLHPETPRRNPAEVLPMPRGVITGLRDTIRATKARLPRFTPEQMQVELQSFPTFSEHGLRDALYQLKKKGELRIVKRGKGNKSSVYEWRIPAKQESAAIAVAAAT